MKNVFKRVLSLGLGLGLSFALNSAALAKDALSPSEAPQLFFDGLYRLDYVQAWQVLSAHSQQKIIEHILKYDNAPGLTAPQIRELFEKGDRSLQRGFWAQMRRSMDILAWHEQSFENGPPSQEQPFVWVKAMPADVLLAVVQENTRWKLGYIETFVERKQQGQTLIKIPVPKASPTPSPKPGR